MIQPPAFIAFTGVDTPDKLPAMQALSARYPIEWGILIDDAQSDKPLFPDVNARKAMLSAPGLRWAAHVCGAEAHTIVNDPHSSPLDLNGFQRVQLNHSFTGSSEIHIQNAHIFGKLRGVRTLLQCGDPFPEDARLDWLYDASFGTGVRPENWPTLPQGDAFCGYSGGIGPQTVSDIINRINAPEGALYWIDMESGVRTDGWLDLRKCEAVCRAVYGDATMRVVQGA
jgi:hypothetical protein